MHGQILLPMGNWKEGEDGLRVSIEATLAWAPLERGEVASAEALVDETVGRGSQQGETLALVDALRVQGSVLSSQGKKDEAEAVLAEGLALARYLQYPHAEARILGVLGKRAEALVIFQRLGAMKDVERIAQAGPSTAPTASC